MDFFGYFRKYLWNVEKTPYLVSVGRLSRTQARNELFTYCVLLAAFFFVTGLAALLGASIVADSIGVAVYSFVLCGAAVYLASTQHPFAALICATAPPVILLYLILYGFSPKLHLLDKLLIGSVILALWVYTFRVVRITWAIPGLREESGPTD